MPANIRIQISCSQILFAIACLLSLWTATANKLNINHLVTLNNEFNQLLQEARTTYQFHQPLKTTSNPLLAAEYAIFFGQHKTCLTMLKQQKTQVDDAYTQLLYGLIAYAQGDYNASIEHYANVPPDSGFYIDAVINRSISFTKIEQPQLAYLLLSQLLHNPVDEQHRNRINLILGHLLLHENKLEYANQYYLNINLDSPYANSALTGKVLIELVNKNYSQALNLIATLKHSPSRDLAYEEAHMLEAHSHQLQEDYITSIYFYQNAIEFYQERILALNQILAHPKIISSYQQNTDYRFIFNIRQTSFNLEALLPASILDNFQHLNQLRDNIHSQFGANNSLYKKITDLHAKYDNLILHALKQRIQQRIKYLQDYIEQSNLALLMLYPQLMP